MGANKNVNDNLIDSLFKLNTKYAIEDSNINVAIINKRIEIYQSLIDNLEENKPLSFEKKELIEYNNKLKEYNSKISYLYDELSKEIEMLDKLYTNM